MGTPRIEMEFVPIWGLTYPGGEEAGLHFHIVWAVESMGSVGDVSGNRACIFAAA